MPRAQPQRVLVYREIDWLAEESEIGIRLRSDHLRRSPMTMREFKVGQHVYYHPRAHRLIAKGRYVVIAVFPQPDGRARDLIRSEDEPSIELRSPQSGGPVRCDQVTAAAEGRTELH